MNIGPIVLESEPVSYLPKEVDPERGKRLLEKWGKVLDYVDTSGSPLSANYVKTIEGPERLHLPISQICEYTIKSQHPAEILQEVEDYLRPFLPFRDKPKTEWTDSEWVFYHKERYMRCGIHSRSAVKRWQLADEIDITIKPE